MNEPASKTEQIINRVLDDVSHKLSHLFYKNQDQIRLIMDDVMDNVKCRHIFTRGKKRGTRCNVLYCKHHVPMIIPRQNISLFRTRLDPINHNLTPELDLTLLRYDAERTRREALNKIK